MAVLRPLPGCSPATALRLAGKRSSGAPLCLACRRSSAALCAPAAAPCWACWHSSSAAPSEPKSSQSLAAVLFLPSFGSPQTEACRSKFARASWPTGTKAGSSSADLPWDTTRSPQLLTKWSSPPQAGQPQGSPLRPFLTMRSSQASSLNSATASLNLETCISRVVQGRSAWQEAERVGSAERSTFSPSHQPSTTSGKSSFCVHECSFARPSTKKIIVLPGFSSSKMVSPGL
mmetsp:Transcript_49450/g.158216  ORF Transcript_49450/g.158216 Transcript_49450/m.158216 type:complete len:232 (-) Transcript_49450:1097-1792(-)